MRCRYARSSLQVGKRDARWPLLHESKPQHKGMQRGFPEHHTSRPAEIIRLKARPSVHSNHLSTGRGKTFQARPNQK